LEVELAETSAEFHVGNLVEIQVLSRGAQKKKIYSKAGYTNSGHQVAFAAKSFMVEPKFMVLQYDTSFVSAFWRLEF
jgi:hypothetical protein